MIRGDTLFFPKLNKKIFAKESCLKLIDSDKCYYTENYVVAYEVVSTRMLLIEKKLKI